MKTISSLLLLSLIVSSCNMGGGNRRTKGRSQRDANPLDGQANPSYNLNNDGSNWNGGSDGNSFSSGPGSTGSTGYDHCNLNVASQSGDVYVSACQSFTQETSFRVKFWLASNSADSGDQTCIVATHTLSNSSSFNLSNSPSCTHHNAGEMMEDNLVKDRQGYTSYPINGVIMMKQRDLNYYYACMDYATTVPQSQNCGGLQPGLSVNQLRYTYPQCLCYYFSLYKDYVELRTR